MPPVPLVSAAQAVRVFEHFGWEIDRRRDSHIILKKRGAPSLSVPNKSTIRQGTLRSLIRRAGLTVEEFWDAC